jgi:hypothetical protein
MSVAPSFGAAVGATVGLGAAVGGTVGWGAAVGAVVGATLDGALLDASAWVGGTDVGAGAQLAMIAPRDVVPANLMKSRRVNFLSDIEIPPRIEKIWRIERLNRFVWAAVFSSLLIDRRPLTADRRVCSR